MESLSKQIVSAWVIAGSLPGTGATRSVSFTLTGWACGGGQSVRACLADAHVGSFNFNSQGGACRGSLTGTDGPDIDDFITYCIELNEHFSFSNNAMTNCRVVQDSCYFATRVRDASIADRLGRLMTSVAGDAIRVNTASESASL